ncbi:MAG TPA: hypothetical protein K8W04_04670 [Bacteroides reticulotermitis]|nr:hypothetical protein [Bacteroides reticulotermitis]
MQNLIKKSHVFMLLSALSLFMILVGCQQSKLKEAIENANKQCPITLGETGEISSIVYDGQNVIYTLSINEALTDMEALKANPESLKTSIMLMLQDPTTDTKDLFTLMVQSKAGLHVTYIGKDSGSKLTCELTHDELKGTLDTQVDSPENDLANLKSHLEIASRELPIQVNKDTRLEEVQLTDKSVIYVSHIDEAGYSLSKIKDSSIAIKRNIIETLSTAGQATHVFINNCVSCDRDIIYRYVGSQSGDHYDVTISIPELKDIIK